MPEKVVKAMHRLLAGCRTKRVRGYCNMVYEGVDVIDDENRNMCQVFIDRDETPSRQRKYARVWLGVSGLVEVEIQRLRKLLETEESRIRAHGYKAVGFYLFAAADDRWTKLDSSLVFRR